MELTKEARETYKRLFGADPQPDKRDPELLAILQNEIFGEVFSTGALDDKQRELITVTAIATLGQLPQLKAHTVAALRAGNTPLEIREAVYSCALYIGWPRTLNAVGAMDEAFESQGITLPLEDAATVSADEREDAGADIQAPLYGDEVKAVFSKLPGVFGEFVPHLLTADSFGYFYTRRGLDVKTREMLSVVILAAMGAATQLKAHISGALKAGNSLLELTAALVQALPYIGIPNAFSALIMIANYDENGSHEAYR